MPQNNSAILERTIQEMSEDKMISELSVSPVDGTAAFLLRRVDVLNNKYPVALCRQRGDDAYECLGEGPWIGINWTKSGKLIGVQRVQGGTRLMRITETGEAVEEAVIPCIGKPIEIDDNGDCVLISRQPVKNGNKDKSVIFTDEYPIFFNDFGLMANTRAALMYFSAETGEVRKITEWDFTVNQYAVDLQRGVVYAAGKAYDNKIPYCEEIRMYSFAEGRLKRFLHDEEWNVTHMILWQGKVAFAGIDLSRGIRSETRLMQLDPDTGAVQVLSEQDLCLENCALCDFRFGAGKVLSATEHGIYACMTRNERSELWQFSLEKDWEIICDSMDTVDMVSATEDRVVFSGHRDLQRVELYDYLPDGSVKKRTDLHPYLPGPDPEAMSVIVNGTEIRGFVLPPENMEEGKLYPAVLSIHGGPRRIYGRVAGHDHRMLSQGGAFVIWCNPTGSDGRGCEFYNLRGKWGDPMQDLIAFVEEAVRRYPIDPKRLGVFGFSYGGYMTNYIIAKTDMFAAAVSERSIATLPWQQTLSDLPTMYRTKEFMGGVFEGEHEHMGEHSPLYVMEKGTTPTLFVQADVDYRCPQVNGAAMYQKLKELGTETEMIVFHGENHAVNRMGKPWNRLKRYDVIYAWLAKRLGMEA